MYSILVNQQPDNNATHSSSEHAMEVFSAALSPRRQRSCSNISSRLCSRFGVSKPSKSPDCKHGAYHYLGNMDPEPLVRASLRDQMARAIVRPYQGEECQVGDHVDSDARQDRSGRCAVTANDMPARK
jgi:hypothetical protein